MSLLVSEGVALEPLSTIRVGGPARYYVRVTSAEEMARAADWAATRRQRVLVLGGGSNIIVADAGFPGLVIHVAVRGIEVVPDGPGVTIRAGAGEIWDDVVRLAVERGLAGLECLSGIPGYVGATPVQNVGAYGQEVAETLTTVEALALESGRSVTFDNAACAFDYRDSRFKGPDRGRYAILEVRYRLRPGGAPLVRYPELARALEELPREPALSDVRQAVLSLRRRKSMVLDEADPCARSVGSFFTNPVVAAPQADAAEEELRRRGHLKVEDSLPRYPAKGGCVKLPAAWLIERCGLPRGLRRGPVGLSERHALAIVNYGGASASDVIAFARDVRAQVRDRSGILLVPEPVLVGLTLE